MKIVFSTLVKSVVEVGWTIWSPFQLEHIHRLQKLQNRFLRIIGTKMEFDYQSVPLPFIKEIMGLYPLIRRRQLQDLMFLHNLITGEVDCPKLLTLIDFRGPGRTRSQHLFGRTFCSTSYNLNRTLPRLHRLSNLVSPRYDFFANGSQRLKTLFLSL